MIYVVIIKIHFSYLRGKINNVRSRNKHNKICTLQTNLYLKLKHQIHFCFSLKIRILCMKQKPAELILLIYDLLLKLLPMSVVLKSIYLD